MSRYVDLWTWFHNYHLAARRAGDDRQVELPRLYERTYGLMETDPQAALTILQEGLALAKQLDEPCWVMFYDYWCCSMYLYYMGDYTIAHEYAVRLVVEARKPQYQSCPILSRIYRNLVTIYMDIDPLGYADEIHETLDFMAAELPLEFDIYCVLTGLRASLAFLLDDFDTAHELALNYLAISQPSSWRMADAHMKLCYFEYFRQNLELAHDHAQETERFGRMRLRRTTIAEAQAWQAVIKLRQGEAEEARRLYRIATTQMGQLGRRTTDSFYDALCDYHEYNGTAENALRLRDQQLGEYDGTGELYGECLCRLARLRLMGRMGLPLADDLAEARQVAAPLLKPARFLLKLDRVQAGDYAVP